MTEQMYSADEAAQILGLQVRTVRNYVRDGRLPGVRIGKQYRIARADLEAFTAGSAGGPSENAGIGAGVGAGIGQAGGLSSSPAASAAAAVEVSCVVQMDGLDAAAGERLERTLIAAAMVGGAASGAFRVEPLYDPARRRLRVVIVGAPAETAEVLSIIDLFKSEP